MSNKVIGLVSMILVGLLACAPSVSDEEESGSESAMKDSEVASKVKGRIVYASQGALTEEGVKLGIKKWTVVAIGKDDVPSQILALASNDTDVIFLLSLRADRDFLDVASLNVDGNQRKLEDSTVVSTLVEEVQLLGSKKPQCEHDPIKYGTLLVLQKLVAKANVQAAYEALSEEEKVWISGDNLLELERLTADQKLTVDKLQWLVLKNALALSWNAAFKVRLLDPSMTRTELD